MSKTITLGERGYSCTSDETVLDSLLRHEVEIPHACRNGFCMTCMVRSLDVMPPAAAQVGLKDTQKIQQYFLACQCRPEHDMHITLDVQGHLYTDATVVEKTLLNKEMVLLSIECKDALDYYAGQFVNLRRNDGLTRSYSIANPTELYNKRLSFHIRRLEHGRFSDWAFQSLQPGDTLQVSEAQGSCFYAPNDAQQNLLLVGTGSGLAPLAGILSDALQQGHTGDIHLFHGSHACEGLYYVDEMRAMAQRHPNFHYTPCVSGGEVPPGYAAGRAHEVALSSLSDLGGWKVFLCGHPQMIQETRRQAFLSGVSSGNIYSDAFYSTS